MHKEEKQRIEVHPYSLSALSPPARSPTSQQSTLCSLPTSPKSARGKRNDSVITVKSTSTNTGSTASFPSDIHSDYTASSSAFHRPGIDYEESDEDLLASAWRHPLAVHAEPVPAMPLHIEEMRTRRSRGGIGTWHIPSAETLCAQIGHDARPHLHRCFLNAFMVPVANCDLFATTRCKRCNLLITHDDESCTRCPARWLREKTGVDETSWLGTRSRLIVDDQSAQTVNRLLTPQTSRLSQ
ncbi:uncharacterized protein CcaverHIS019_0102770 [Cutaneotrichosporon cavernicola]|uniref:Uncharacterized protein n=1 Tax=Cutaneotrichosporon cavernicola TaxID=279322 RepID=A0AA48KWV3_9TREE|nr:uncharacterized protein CcaverHIS019_0102770 [Cutaneotrichosporon cavernicola]BEI87559.1 hypothetical protein CcaverHIS019_0102770 [Cutaneotrichosporon cavernicola]BEI95330.1 hypothetical protein CcaverHIS631_0102790 [Cutaneotrichosporon cavernicola]BEJ03104.1 hypothetical protein CcaverHIS641_0102790 [Cutaneotrichosporon cavernicola]